MDSKLKQTNKGGKFSGNFLHTNFSNIQKKSFKIKQHKRSISDAPKHNIQSGYLKQNSVLPQLEYLPIVKEKTPLKKPSQPASTHRASSSLNSTDLNYIKAKTKQGFYPNKPDLKTLTKREFYDGGSHPGLPSNRTKSKHNSNKNSMDIETVPESKGLMINQYIAPEKKSIAIHQNNASTGSIATDKNYFLLSSSKKSKLNSSKFALGNKGNSDVHNSAIICRKVHNEINENEYNYNLESDKPMVQVKSNREISARKKGNKVVIKERQIICNNKNSMKDINKLGYIDSEPSTSKPITNLKHNQDGSKISISKPNLIHIMIAQNKDKKTSHIVKELKEYKNKASLKNTSNERLNANSKRKLNSINSESTLNKISTKDKEDSLENLLNDSLESNISYYTTPQYYRKESNKVSKYIKRYLSKYDEYPKTKLQFYKIGRFLGKGAFGKVNLGLHILAGRLVAIKSFNKKKVDLEKLRRKIGYETMILSSMHHRNVVKIYETFETQRYYMISMEYISCGDLLSYVRKRTKLSEQVAKFIYKQIVLGIKHIHSRGIVHRDIKLDNILIDIHSNIKICDFGVAKKMKRSEIFYDQCGTPAYIAPEILLGQGYEGSPVDIWSSGVVLYAMLSGTVPFKASNIKDLHKLIIKGQFPSVKGISSESQDLISRILDTDPNRRIRSDEILRHAWMDFEDIDMKDISNEYLK